MFFFQLLPSPYSCLLSILELDVEKVMKIALEYNVTVYDASYIELAREHSMPIASNDRDILDVAPKLGVKVYDLKIERLKSRGHQRILE
ncbi:MAG TPA: PIN domain-containing protein [Aquificae bacterium]|nr:PIN domain-containing protein [Aquificota bacterium]